jgi:predicted porin
MGTLVDGEDRVPNVLALISPSMGGMKGMIALVPGEGNGNTPGALSGSADAISAAFTYDAKNLFVSLANNSGDAIDDQTRLVATYKMDGMQLGAIYSTTDFGTADDQVSMGLSFGMKVTDAGKVKFQYIDATDMAGAAGADETRMDIGYDHSLSKSTTVYALYDTFDTLDRDAMSFGLQHKF